MTRPYPGFDRAAAVLRRAQDRGWRIAVAESLTGGLVSATLTAVPGASGSFAGGLTAYSEAVKASVLGVDAGMLARRGAVCPGVALAMAEGVATLLDAQCAVATTGVAGPGPQPAPGGRSIPAGTVVVAARTPQAAVARTLHCIGERENVRDASVIGALSLLLALLGGGGRGGPQGNGPDVEGVLQGPQAGW